MIQSSAKHGAYRPWAVRTVVVRLSRKLTATYRLRSGRLLSRLLTVMLAGFSTLATALPEGASLVAGQASISTPTPNAMVVTQRSDKAILNWQSFNIGTGQSMQFVQPGAASVALNRVVGANPSSIYGSLSANGQVFLINPAGVMFAPGAQVHVGGLVASTLALGNEDFMAGRYTFSSNGNAGTVTNGGNIRAARGGYVLLAAPSVSNTGSINADAGSVGLVAGARVSVDTSGAGLVSFSVDASAANAVAANSGVITAQGGQVAVLASALGDVMATVINQTGVIRATSAAERDGMIVLSGGSQGVVNVTGELTATGLESGQTGGTVKVLGDKVALTAGAVVNVSGAAGGGTALIGGDYQGKTASVQNARRTYVGPDVTIQADAISNGNGGKVIVWSDDVTHFHGSIAAKGGALGGDGGFVETSGKNILQALGNVNASAPKGTAGQWLLDPNNITIQSAGPDANVTASPNFSTTNDSAIVTTGSIQAALNGGTSVTVTTASLGTNGQAGNIIVANALAKTAGTSATLTLNSSNNITFSAGADVTSTVGALGLTLNAPGAINTLRNVSLNGGTLTLNATGAGSQSGTIQGTTSVVKQGAGIFTLSGANTYSGGTTIKAGTLSGTRASAFGTGVITIGDSVGSADATLNGGFAGTHTNAISVASGNAGVASISSSANSIFSGAVTLNSHDLRLSPTLKNSLTLSGGITGSGNLGIRGTGTTAAVTLSTTAINNTGTITNSGSNTGTTTISAAVGANVTAITQNSTTSALTVSGALSVNSAGTTLTNSAGTKLLTVTGAVSGTGDLVLNNNSALANGITLSGAGTINNTGTVTNSGSGSGSTLVSKVISTGVTGVVQNSATSQLTLSGVNTYTGATTISAGTLALNATGTIAASSGVANAGTLTIAAAKTIDSLTGAGATTLGANTLTIGDASNTSSTYSGVASGTGGLTKAGTGTLTLSGANTYTGATTINAGTLAYGAANALATGAVTVAGGTLDMATFSDSVGAVTLSSGSITGTTGVLTGTSYAMQAGSVSAILGGTGALTKTTAGTVTLSGANTYTGATTINAGTLSVNSLANGGLASNIGRSTNAATNLVLGGGTLQYTGTTASTDRNYTLTALTTSSVDVTSAASNLTLGGASTATTGALTKVGAGTLTLGGVNRYTGATAVNAGTLRLGAAERIADTSAVSVSSGATLDLNNFSETVASITSAGLVTFGTGNTLTTTGAQTYTGQVTGGVVTLVSTGGGSIAATNVLNDFTGSLAVTTSGAANIVDVNALVLGTSSVGGTLGVTTAGAITQSGALSVAGATTLAAGSANDITLTNTGNDFASVGITSANNVNLRDSNALVLGASAVNGTLGVTTAGALTQSGALTVSVLKVKTLDNAGSAITLTNTGNDVGTIDLQARNAGDTANAAGAIQYTDVNGFDVAALTTTGNATLSAGGTVTQSGAISASGLLLAGTGGDHRLRHAGNAVTTLAANTGSIDYSQSGALTVGTVAGVVGVTTAVVAKIETTGAGSDLTLTNAVTSNGTGDAIVLKAGSSNAAGTSTGGKLVNNAGVNGIGAASGRYLVYSGDPATTTEGVTGYNKRYNTSSSFTPGGSANMFLYRIAPTLTITSDNATRSYGQANPVFTGNATGFIDGDTAATVGVTRTSAAVFNTPVAASGIAITSGATNNQNYTLVLGNGQLTIRRAPINSVSGITASNKTVDGNTSATLNAAGAGYAGMVSGDVLTVASATGNFDSSSVGSNKKVFINGITLGGASADNYELINSSATTTASITDLSNLAGSFFPSLPMTPLPPSRPAWLNVAQANALLEGAPTASGGCLVANQEACAPGGRGVLVRTVRELADGQTGIFAVDVTSELVSAGEGFRFTLPASLRAWILASGEAVRATTFMGQPLPVWLRYEAETLTFVARAVPAGALPLRIRMVIGEQSAVFTISPDEEGPARRRQELIERSTLADSSR